jgi:ABC-type Mn2+/Zn2+ transport system ATPase subunit
VIAGVLRPSSGRVTTQAKSDALEIAYVPQRSQVDWNFPVSVADVVMMGRTGRIGLLRWPSARDREIVRESLEAVGMTKYAKRQVGELSGGQQQRVFIARALAQQADLMLMDEPLTGLDITSQEDIFSILDQLKQRGVTIIVTIHDLNLAAEHFDRVMLLNHEMIGLGQPDDVFTPERLQKAYGGSMRVIPTNGGVVLLGDSHCGEGHTH